MKFRTKKSHRLQAVFAALSLVACSVVIAPVHADTYHAVDKGETLSAISKRYSVSTAALREANKLSNLSDNAPLPSMLLRVPTASDKIEKTRDAGEFKARTPAPSAARYFGTVTRTISYKVKNGDTLESISAAFSREGQTVSVAEMRVKNHLGGQPQAGSTLLIPITTTYGAKPVAATKKVAAPISQVSAQMQPQAQTQSATARSAAPKESDGGVIGVAVSDEVALPFARAIPTAGTPSYQAPNTSRGNLSARGGYGAMVDGARVLQNGEELLSAPSPRVRSSALPSTHNLAKVAKIAKNGARIRRLPEADAATLYNCAVGTEIAILKQKGMWSAILMSDRSTGWLPTHYLKFTGVSVDITSQVETTGRQDSDDSVSGYTGGYQSNHPAVRYALRWLGTPYRYGGESTRGIDCSSLVQKSFAACGKKLPRVSRDQAKVGQRVEAKDLQPGDRLYFSASGTHVDHTGIYMGNGLFVHASGGARKVTVSRLSDKRNWNIFVGARR
jgi:cell wall-associated NlpC family hydrolase